MGVIAVGISGAQGAGKSTLLNELKKQDLYVDDFKVSRAVQKKLGWNSLEEVMQSPAQMMKFQNMVLDEKYENDSRFPVLNRHVVLTERTFADVVAYTNLWTWKFVDQERMNKNEALRFLAPFADRAAKAQSELYQGTVLVPLMPHVKWEQDSHRASKADANAVYSDIERFFTLLPVTHQLYTVREKTVPLRAQEVLGFVQRVALIRTGS